MLVKSNIKVNVNQLPQEGTCASSLVFSNTHRWTTFHSSWLSHQLVGRVWSGGGAPSPGGAVLKRGAHGPRSGSPGPTSHLCSPVSPSPLWPSDSSSVKWRWASYPPLIVMEMRGQEGVDPHLGQPSQGALPRGRGGGESPASSGDTGDLGSASASGRSVKKETATRSSFLAWEILWTEEPGGLQTTGFQRVRRDWARTHAWPRTPGLPRLSGQRRPCEALKISCHNSPQAALQTHPCCAVVISGHSLRRPMSGWGGCI